MLWDASGPSRKITNLAQSKKTNKQKKKNNTPYLDFDGVYFSKYQKFWTFD